MQVSDGEIPLNVAQIIVHNQYNKTSFQDNDFALLKLATPIPISNTVGIACIAPDISYDKKTVIITGWGYTSPSGPQSPTLKQANVVAMSNSECAASGMRKSKLVRNSFLDLFLFYLQVLHTET